MQQFKWKELEKICKNRKTLTFYYRRTVQHKKNPLVDWFFITWRIRDKNMKQIQFFQRQKIRKSAEWLDEGLRPSLIGSPWEDFFTSRMGRNSLGHRGVQGIDDGWECATRVKVCNERGTNFPAHSMNPAKIMKKHDIFKFLQKIQIWHQKQAKLVCKFI